VIEPIHFEMKGQRKAPRKNPKWSWFPSAGAMVFANVLFETPGHWGGVSV
jgi:hypothetical protein